MSTVTALATKPEKPETEAEKKERLANEEEARELARMESENRVSVALEAATKALAEAKKLKDADFDEVEDDFFKFETKGDTVQGVYLGVINERIKAHCLASVDKAGNPIVVRVNGTRQLASTLERLAPFTVGDDAGKPRYYVRLEYLGKEKTGNGREVKKFKIGTKPIGAVAPKK